MSAGSLLGRPGLIRAGMRTGLLAVASLLDIGRRPAVPGANDNLSAVAGLLELARRLQERPVEGLRVLLVSCGAEEALQEGMLGLARRHFLSLPTGSTWFVNLETVGSPELALLEGEGVLAMREYEEQFKDFVTEQAAAAGVRIRRGLRSRSSTDGSIARRAGYPTVTLISVNAWKALSNYHLPTDTPENVNYETVSRAIEAPRRRCARWPPTRARRRAARSCTRAAACPRASAAPSPRGGCAARSCGRR